MVDLTGECEIKEKAVGLGECSPQVLKDIAKLLL